MYFSFYNRTSVRGFTSMLTVVCAKTVILWIFPTSSKMAPFHIIHFILTKFNNENNPCKHVIVDEDGSLVKSTDVTNLLVDYFRMSMESTGGDASWINVNNERHNKSIHKMFRAGLIDSNQHENKWCCAAETSAEVYIFKLHISLHNNSPHFAWYDKKPRIHEPITFRCDIYTVPSSPKRLNGTRQEISFMGYTKIRATMKWWDPHTKKLKYCSSAYFDEYNNKFGK